MLTLITGTPGAGKTLHAVAEYAAKVPGSVVPGPNGQDVPRTLYTNIRDLTIEHTHIEAADLECWQTWAKPGDVIMFDEVQEVWRPRGLGSKVPECIAALETHRHKGVDLVLITQHPMLVDGNIRRLVNQHLHLRRLSKSVAYVYEWDHCAQPGQVKTCLQARVWFHPKKAYSWYKSAQLHTKPTARMPRLAIVGLLAAAGLAYMAPTAYGRITERFVQQSVPAKAQAPAQSAKVEQPPAVRSAAVPTAQVAPPFGQPAKDSEVRPVGCIATLRQCECFAGDGLRLQVSADACIGPGMRPGFMVPLLPAGVTREPSPPAAARASVPDSMLTPEERRAVAGGLRPGTVDDAGNTVVRNVALPVAGS